MLGVPEVCTRRCDPTELFPVLSQVRARLAPDPRRRPALDSRMRVRSSRDARRGFHRASTSGNVASGYSACARRVRLLCRYTCS
jgi:hypothetical protein